MAAEAGETKCSGVPEAESVIEPGVIEAYRTAQYSFQVGQEKVEFRIGQRCGALAGMLREPGQAACCITAYNPLGVEAEKRENEAASEELRRALEGNGCRWLAASGEATDGSWGPEPGYMAFGLSCEEAIGLGRRFRQNAIVWIGGSGVPELVLLR